MTKFHEFSVTPVSYYLRHIVMIYFSPHEVVFVVGCKTITPQAVHISYRTWGEKDKAIPVQDWTDPEGSRSSRFPDFKRIRT
jgi:hypothetical protein